MNTQLKSLVTRLIDDVKCDKWYGNPFSYLVENWDHNGPSGGRQGKLIVEAACDTFDFGEYLSKETVQDLKIAYDIWVDMNVIQLEGRHTKCDMELDDLMKCIDAVRIFRTVRSDITERQLKNSYYKKVEELTAPDEQGPGMDKCHAGVWVIEFMLREARDLRAEHEQRLSELDDLAIRDQIRDAESQ